MYRTTDIYKVAYATMQGYGFKMEMERGRTVFVFDDAARIALEGKYDSIQPLCAATYAEQIRDVKAEMHRFRNDE